MLTFQHYIHGRGNRGKYLLMGEAAKSLASITDDPEGFLLDLVEHSIPHAHAPLLEAFYLEADPGPVDDPSAPDAPRPASAVSGGSEYNASDSGSIMDWLRDLFGGGGAEKSFNRALTALKKVDSVLRTVRVPPEAQGEDGAAPGYDEYRDKMSELYKALTEMGKQSKNLNVADAIKKDPTYVQELENNPELKKAMEEDVPPPEEAAAGPEAEILKKFKPEFEAGRFNTFDGATQAAAQAEYPAIQKMPDGPEKDKAIVDWMKKHNHSAFKSAPGTVKPEVLKKYRAEFDADRFTTFDTAHQANAQKEYAPIKAMADGPEKDKAIMAFMTKFNHRGLKESRRRKGRLVTENAFAEALVLAGIPPRRKK